MHNRIMYMGMALLMACTTSIVWGTATQPSTGS
jgi:hypothetical protein